MIPLFAAVSAVDAAGKLAGSVASLWQHKSSASAQAGGGAPTSFASLLKTNGVELGKHFAGQLASAQTTGTGHAAPGSVNLQA